MINLTAIQPQKDEIYLDNNATTQVLPQAVEAATHTMQYCYGNPSSSHITGIKAKYILESTRNLMRKIIGAQRGEVTFTSGATEGIQTSILSALIAAREQGISDNAIILYGATEHKAVPETLKHWNKMLGIMADIVAIPVDDCGLLDHAFIREKVPNAIMICTMAANNETGVFQDLAALETVIRSANPNVLWMVDCVQALGKMDLDLDHMTIDYAPFSGHKLYAPKGVGVLYVRENTPFTPFIAGGGQESGLRSGTENLPGIAALHAVLTLLADENDHTFKPHDVLVGYRDKLVDTLKEVFPAIVFNHDFDTSLPTTINFSVNGLSSKDIMDLFDAARIRVSSGSACSSKVTGSFVLDAMGKPKWQSESAIRLSFGPAATDDEIERACKGIKQAVSALKHSCLILSDTTDTSEFAFFGLQQWVYDQQCAWFYVDKESKQCVVIDLLPELVNKFETLVTCQQYEVTAILDTHRHTDAPLTSGVIQELFAEQMSQGEFDALGWKRDSLTVRLENGQQVAAMRVGKKIIAKINLPGHTQNSVGYLLGNSQDGQLNAANVDFAFVGDTVQIGGLGRTDLVDSDPMMMFNSLLYLQEVIHADTPICPSHDYQQLFYTTLNLEQQSNPLLLRVLNGEWDASRFIEQKNSIDLRLTETDKASYCGQIDFNDSDVSHIAAHELGDFICQHPDIVVVDVREPHEFEAYPDATIGGKRLVNVPLSQLVDFIHRHRFERVHEEYICICRSGNRSDAASKTLKRNGFEKVYQVPGGFALLGE